MKVAIIGGGAAGFFAAINIKENYPNAVVTIFEKSAKILSKVKVSGGGRCNVTNGIDSIKELAKAYPRGEKQLRKVFGVFSNTNTMQWFESRGVALVTQTDNCVFPKSQNSQSVIDCFLSEVNRLDISIRYKKGVLQIEEQNNQLELRFADNTTQLFDKIIVATGGAPKRKNLDWLANLGHDISSPVPSLFTFNMPDESITKLMGIVVENATVSIQGTKLKSNGALLITHWGMSGPAILKLSAFGARVLSEKDYQFKVQVNWIDILNTDGVKREIEKIVSLNSNKQLATVKPFRLQTRLWHYLLSKIDLPLDRKWKEIGNKGMNKMVNILTNDVYQAQGKTTFKEEFVTCGGISLQGIDFKTMQSKKVKNLYFTGEVLDIDGITGGFNFQAAWSTAFVAAMLK